MTHDEAAELLGAYALNAVDPDEAVFVEAHVATCPRCEAELFELREVAGRLGDLGGDASAELWTAIESQATSPGLAPAPVDLGAHARRRNRRQVPVLGAVAAVVVAMLVLMAARIGTLDGAVGALRSESTAHGLTQAAQVALLDPTASRVTLTSNGKPGRRLVELVVLAGGHSFVVQSSLVALSSSKTYQLWAIGEGRQVSLALLGRAPRIVPFVVNVAARGTVYAITVEPAAGSVAPTTSPVAIST